MVEKFNRLDQKIAGAFCKASGKKARQISRNFAAVKLAFAKSTFHCNLAFRESHLKEMLAFFKLFTNFALQPFSSDTIADVQAFADINI